MVYFRFFIRRPKQSQKTFGLFLKIFHRIKSNISPRQLQLHPAPSQHFSQAITAGYPHTIFHQQSQAASHRIRHKCHSTTNKRNRRKKGPKRMRSGPLISIFLQITAYLLDNSERPKQRIFELFVSYPSVIHTFSHTPLMFLLYHNCSNCTCSDSPDK